MHEENNENVLFATCEERVAVDRALQQATKLAAYFQLNASLAPADRLLYADVPTHYRWDGAGRKWC